MTEHDLQNLIRKELTKHGGRCFRYNIGDFYTKDGRYIPSSLPKGHSDLGFVKNGQISYIEVKVRPNKPEPEQDNFIEQMKTLGCNAGVAYSVEDALKICGVI